MSLAETPPSADTPSQQLTAQRVQPLRRPGRWIGTAVVLVLVAQIIHGLATNPFYQWDRFRYWFLRPTILDGLVITLEVTALSAVLGLLTKPGPYLPRTVELGTYLGIRHRGRLVAMAGERLHPPGWTEISAVCTHPDHRGQGLATRLVRAIAVGIRERGETPFLHAAADNTNAIRLYESIGFTLRRRTNFVMVRTPGAQPEETA